MPEECYDKAYSSTVASCVEKVSEVSLCVKEFEIGFLAQAYFAIRTLTN
jgi:hypothetical protein